MASVSFAPDERASIFIAVLSGCERTSWIHPQLAKFLLLYHNSARLEFRKTFVDFLELCPVDRARNFATKHFLESGAEYLLSLDNDAIPYANFAEFVSLAIRDRKDFAVPRFHGIGVLTNEPESPTLNWNPAVHPVRPGDIDERGWLPLSSCGGHAMLIHRRVFEKIVPPWFENQSDEFGTIRSEDVTFCDKARAAGFTIHGNMRFVVGHAKTANIATFADYLEPGPTRDMCRDSSASATLITKP